MISKLSQTVLYIALLLLVFMFIFTPDSFLSKHIHCLWLKNQTSLLLVSYTIKEQNIISKTNISNNLQKLSNCQNTSRFIGRGYFFINLPEESEKWLKNQTDPSTRSWLKGQIIRSIEKKDNDTLGSASNIYITLYPEDSYGYLQLGLFYRYKKDYTNARKFYELSAQKDQSASSLSNFFIGQTYAENNAVDKAIPWLKAAIDSNSNQQQLNNTDFVTAYYWIGVGYTWQSLDKDAEYYLREAFRIAEERNVVEDWLICGIKLSLGQNLHKQGKNTEAATQLEEVIRQCNTRPQETSIATAELKKIRNKSQ